VPRTDPPSPVRPHVRPASLNLLVFGPQGSGKGTQAKLLEAEYGIPHVSTGDIFRAAIGEATPLGVRVKAILDSGELVPDELTVSVVRERLEQPDTAHGFVLDGFPRNLPQRSAARSILSSSSTSMTMSHTNGCSAGPPPKRAPTTHPR
jgi:adenylate kinase